MKFIDRIIEDIPMVEIEKEDSKYHDEVKYLIDSRVLLNNLKEYEIEIPQEFYDKYKDKFGNGVLQYMEVLTNVNMKDFGGANTYNWGGRIIHDFDYRYVDLKDAYYVAIQVHRFGDIRGNYTDFALLKFDNFESFIERVDEESYSSGGCFEYNGKHYFYDLSIFCEWLRVWCEENQEDYEFYAYNDESFIEEIRKVEDENGK